MERRTVHEADRPPPKVKISPDTVDEADRAGVKAKNMSSSECVGTNGRGVPSHAAVGESRARAAPAALASVLKDRPWLDSRADSEPYGPDPLGNPCNAPPMPILSAGATTGKPGLTPP